MTIKFSAMNYQGTVNIALVRGKIYFLEVRKDFPVSAGHLGKSYSVTWNIPEDVENGSYRIIVRADSTLFDRSDSSFTISKLVATANSSLDMVRPKLTIITPNGGERFLKTRNMRIRWKKERFNGTLRISIKKGAVDVHSFVPATINGPYNGNEYNCNWAIPRTVADGSDYRVEIRGSAGFPYDLSDDVFTITGKNIEVFSPRAGVTWYATERQGISFRTEGISQKLKIQLDCCPVDMVINLPASATMHMWDPVGELGDVVPAPARCRVVVMTMDGTVKGYSQYFNLRHPEIDVTRPSSGSVRYRGTTSIRWSAPHVSGNVTITVLTPNPGHYTGWSHFRDIAVNTANDGSHSWVANLPVGNRYKIKIKSIRCGWIYGTSAPFTLTVAGL